MDLQRCMVTLRIRWWAERGNEGLDENLSCRLRTAGGCRRWKTWLRVVKMWMIIDVLGWRTRKCRNLNATRILDD